MGFRNSPAVRRGNYLEGKVQKRLRPMLLGDRGFLRGQALCLGQSHPGRGCVESGLEVQDFSLD